MGTSPDAGSRPPPPADLERELRRVVDRLHHLSLDRLGSPAPPWPSAAVAARQTAQLLADLAQDVEERDRPGPPVRHVVPELAVQAAGDQVAVTGADLLRALRDVPAGPAEDVVRRAADALVTLRRAL